MSDATWTTKKRLSHLFFNKLIVSGKESRAFETAQLSKETCISLDSVESSKQNPEDCLPDPEGEECVQGPWCWYVDQRSRSQIWGVGSPEEEQAGGGSLHTAPAPLRCSTPARATHSAHAHTIVTFLICCGALLRSLLLHHLPRWGSSP